MGEVQVVWEGFVACKGTPLLIHCVTQAGARPRLNHRKLWATYKHNQQDREFHTSRGLVGPCQRMTGASIMVVEVSASPPMQQVLYLRLCAYAGPVILCEHLLEPHFCTNLKLWDRR